MTASLGNMGENGSYDVNGGFTSKIILKKFTKKK